MFYFEETVLTEISQRIALDDRFDRNVEKLTKSLTLTDAFTTFFLTLPRFVRTVAKFICVETKKEMQRGYNIIKKNEWMSLSSSTSLSGYDSSMDLKLRKLELENTEKADKLMTTNERVAVNIRGHQYLRAARSIFHFRFQHPK